MQLVMVAKVTFAAMRQRPEMVIRKVTMIDIDTSWKNLTDTCEITIARNVKDFDKYNVKQVFQRGDPVKVELGYDNKFITEFEGYVSSVSANIPIVIKCEDEMFKLKTMPVNFSTGSINLQGLLKAVVPGYDIDALEGVPLGAVRLAKTTVSKALQKLESDFGLHSFFRGKQLVCGKYYAQATGLPPHKFHLERNCVSNALNYRSKDQLIVLIKATSILAGGNKITTEFGTDGGDRLELTYYNIKVKSELDALVRQDYEKRVQDGFDGSFTSFGIPSVKHGEKVQLESFIYPDRNGIYYIDAVKKTFKDDATYRQEITLGDKAAA